MYALRKIAIQHERFVCLGIVHLFVIECNGAVEVIVEVAVDTAYHILRILGLYLSFGIGYGIKGKGLLEHLVSVQQLLAHLNRLDVLVLRIDHLLDAGQVVNLILVLTSDIIGSGIVSRFGILACLINQTTRFSNLVCFARQLGCLVNDCLLGHHRACGSDAQHQRENFFHVMFC